MQMEDNETGEPRGMNLVEEAVEADAPRRRGIAPWWHTVLLLAGMTALTLQEPARLLARHLPATLMGSYGVAAVGEALMLLWVLFGLKLYGQPLRAITGNISFRPGAILQDLGVAMLAWLCIMTVLGTLSISWLAAEKVCEMRHQPAEAHQMPAPSRDPLAGLHDKTEKAVAALAPSTGREMVCWLLLCILVGIAEELVFRGYLVAQFIEWFACWPRMSVALGVALAAVIFGAAHLYQGARGIFLITIFGALLSMLAFMRRNLRAGIMVHIWQDMIAGIGLALLKSQHYL
jgi:hypothetical protein